MPVILDGTHCRKDYRQEALTLLRSYGYNRVEVVILETSLSNCLKHNAARKRKVPEHVVEQMHSDLQQSLKTIMEEPFDAFHFVY
jgi:predicted kinase